MLLEIAGALATAVWFYLLFGRGGFWREFRHAEPMPQPSPAAQPRVAAVIPARDEARVIGQAIDSLAAQEALHIVVVDDSSADGTADAAREAAPAGRRRFFPLPSGSGRLC